MTVLTFHQMIRLISDQELIDLVVLLVASNPTSNELFVMQFIHLSFTKSYFFLNFRNLKENLKNSIHKKLKAKQIIIKFNRSLVIRVRK